MKIRENEKICKYLNLSKEMKKLWNMKVTMIPTFIDAFETALKDEEKRQSELEIRKRIDTRHYYEDRLDYSET